MSATSPTSAGSISDSLRGVMQSENVQKLLPYLLSGGAGAAVGAASTGFRRSREGESRGAYLSRILRNAALAGGLAAGGHYAVQRGAKSLAGGGADAAKASPAEQTEGPVDSIIRGIAFNPATAAGAGGLGLALTHGSEVLGVGKDQSATLGALGKIVKKSPEHLQALSNTNPAELRNILTAASGGTGGLSPEFSDMRRRAGLTLEDLLSRGNMKTPGAWKGVASRLARGARTFGQTPGTAAKRLAVGTTAALLPATAGAFTTRSKDEPAS